MHRRRVGCGAHDGFASRKAAYVWQRGRFEDDEALWKEWLTDPASVKSVKSGSALHFHLPTKSDLQAFRDTATQGLQESEWHPRGAAPGGELDDEVEGDRDFFWPSWRGEVRRERIEPAATLPFDDQAHRRAHRLRRRARRVRRGARSPARDRCRDREPRGGKILPAVALIVGRGSRQPSSSSRARAFASGGVSKPSLKRLQRSERSERASALRPFPCQSLARLVAASSW